MINVALTERVGGKGPYFIVGGAQYLFTSEADPEDRKEDRDGGEAPE